MERMHRLADEIRETFEERGWKIEKAVRLDTAFTKTRRPGSSLSRSLVLDAVEAASSRVGLGHKTVTGGGCDVTDVVDMYDRHFRVLKADVDPETGEYDIISGSEALMSVESETDSLLTPERWVLGYTVDGEGLVVDIFAARVLGLTDDAVPHLILGPVTLLGAGGLGTPPVGGGFSPSPEDDLGDGFNEGQSDDDDSGEFHVG